MTFTAPDATLETLIASVGRPAESYEFRIVDEEGQSVERGKTGEIQVRGDFLMTGYWQRPQASATAFDADGWLRTGTLRFSGRMATSCSSDVAKMRSSRVVTTSILVR